MAKPIVVRVVSLVDLTLQWLDESSVNVCQVKQGSLDEFKKIITDQEVILLLPAAEVSLVSIDLPLNNKKQIKKALPFALEEFLADDVEVNHYVWISQPDNKIIVAVINNERFIRCISSFDSAGITLLGVYSEVLFLPYEKDGCSIGIDNQNAIIRMGNYLGGGSDLSALSIILKKLIHDNQYIKFLQIFSQEDVVNYFSDIVIQKTQHETNLAYLFLKADISKVNTKINLLNDQVKLIKKTQWRWQEWLPTLAVIVVALVLQWGILLDNFWQEEKNLTGIESATLNLFKETFPEVKRIVNIKAQADLQLSELKSHALVVESRFMQLIYKVGDVLKDNKNIVVKQIEFDKNNLQVQLVVFEVDQVEQIKHQIENHGQLSVNIISEEVGQKGVSVHYEIN